MTTSRTNGDPRTAVRARLRGAAVAVVLSVWAAPVAAQTTAPPAAKVTKTTEKTNTESKTKSKAVPLATETEWEEALNAFRYQDFDQAIAKLRALLYPKPRVEESRAWRAREYLASSLWWSQKRKAASDEFTALLVRNPGAKLDPGYYPPQMLKDLEKLRGNLIRLGVIKRGVVRKPRPTGKGKVAPPPLALALFPFGVGQFANRQLLKGGLFLGAQAALASASSALYLYNRDMARVGQRSTPAAIGQLTTGGLFWGLVIWGVTDALLTRRAQDRPPLP